MQGEIIYANSATIRKLGYTQEELYKMTVIELNPKDARDEAEQVFADMLAGKRINCPLALEKKKRHAFAGRNHYLVWFVEWSRVYIRGIKRSFRSAGSLGPIFKTI